MDKSDGLLVNSPFLLVKTNQKTLVLFPNSCIVLPNLYKSKRKTEEAIAWVCFASGIVCMMLGDIVYHHTETSLCFSIFSTWVCFPTSQIWFCFLKLLWYLLWGCIKGSLLSGCTTWVVQGRSSATMCVCVCQPVRALDCRPHLLHVEIFNKGVLSTSYH